MNTPNSDTACAKRADAGRLVPQTAIAGNTWVNPLRALHWKHPRISFPAIIEQAIAKLRLALDTPKSALWLAMFGAAPVLGGGKRVRCKRSDGSINVMSLLMTLVASSDIERGIVATPAQAADAIGWDRKTWKELDFRSFGPLVEGLRSDKRTQRAAAELIAQGFIVSVQMRRLVKGTKTFESMPGVKIVTDKFWKAIGLWSGILAERHRRKMVRRTEKRAAALEKAAKFAASLAGGSRRQARQAAKPSTSAASATPGSPAAHPAPFQAREGPSRSIGSEAAAAAAIAELQRKLR